MTSRKINVYLQIGWTRASLFRLAMLPDIQSHCKCKKPHIIMIVSQIVNVYVLRHLQIMGGLIVLYITYEITKANYSAVKLRNKLPPWTENSFKALAIAFVM